MNKFVTPLVAIAGIIWLSSCSTVSRLAPTHEHRSDLMYSPTKPVNLKPEDIDTSESNTADYALEGYGSQSKNGGKPIIMFVKAPVMYKILTMPWEERKIDFDSPRPAYVFTGNLLRRSNIPKNVINASNFSEQQIAMIMRERNTEKYQVFNYIGMIDGYLNENNTFTIKKKTATQTAPPKTNQPVKKYEPNTPAPTKKKLIIGG